ncbi:S24/S26 family peptidase [Bacillus sp. 1NLA3E]|uniref:S24/S26 family peptidase n=1 Tax=Bacillus sp. 1NLA3E TaxID=666686 RepID=UPI000247E732|nr:S24/S26 family peptidase [Bacillus sp. 1NLA3E]AGK52675.1 hypothetical protein B1NLA3E_04505 [Bacillus sp. 1NLA3E]
MLFDKENIILFKKNIRNHGFIDWEFEGNSMFPLIQKGNICRFVYCEPFKLIKGDIVLYYSETGQLVAHRFFHTKLVKEQRHYLFKGDTNFSFDQPVTEEQIIGKLAFIKKVDKKVWMADLPMGLWGKTILLLPFTSIILGNYINLKNAFNTNFMDSYDGTEETSD